MKVIVNYQHLDFNLCTFYRHKQLMFCVCVRSVYIYEDAMLCSRLSRMSTVMIDVGVRLRSAVRLS